MSLPVAIIAYVFSAVLIVALVVGNVYALRYADLVSIYFGQSTQRVVPVEGENAEYFASDFDSEEDRQAYLTSVATDITREGATLLTNSGALPLAEGARISVLGQNSVDPVFGGGGAGSIDPSEAVTLEAGLTEAGFEINDVLGDFYTDGAGADFRKATPDVYGEGSFAVNEVPQSAYTDEVIASFGDYSDAAVVVIGRSGGESSDLPTTPGDDGYTYLQLNDDERDLLALADENFETVVVVLNTQTPIELDTLDVYDIAATLWVGALGQTGSTAVGEVLAGTVNPSGALVDTYAYDSLSAPSIANFGDYTITNSTVERGDKYVVYGEGIYVGYRYYETRYDDVVKGAESASSFDYAAEVQYPFGYGSSYTTFSWDDYAVADADDTYEASVTVTNTGDVAGKDIVQIYLQSPYTDYDRENGIEKAAVELVGYAKTGELAPGESETVTVSVPKELTKVYDAAGFGTYIVDAGEYFLAAGDNAHAALNTILTAQGYSTADGMDAAGDEAFVHSFAVDALDSTTYAVSQATGAAITNQFQDVDVRAYDPDFAYLSRSDWTGTWPTTYQEGSWEAPAELLADLEIQQSENPDAVAPTFETVDDAYGELTTATLIGEDYDNQLWTALLQQASFEELEQLVRIGGYATRSVDSIQLPGTTVKDGPAGFSATLVGGDGGMGYPPAVVLASTWNDELAEQMGVAIGEDSLELGIAGWYAPSMNLHRSPYSGRNFEYYSEDSVLSGQMAAAVIAGAQSKGVIVFAKHFALNDQEANRVGGAVFADEQTTRQLYLLPFEYAVREGDALGMMDSMNRIGATWSGAHAGLLTETLRGEWGFEGVVVTDQASFSVFAYEDLRAGLAAGTDLWLNTDASLWVIPDDEVTPTVEANVVRAAHNIAFAVAHSNAMNGLSAGATIESVVPLWQWTLIVADIVLGLLALLLVFLVTRKLVRQRRVARANAVVEGA
ncbi:glycoside hydrolase family 3 C-terminal domain-containing protein [Agromyces atrinae]|uniref:glycoside hydrolase family 3 protein n=1 Tax=Agromyces atrinae TaxID=592376 RepID=UPI001F57D03C|nr:glycoside hydrolase family 3 protein [Agromyces atrinae]MCI2956862.1 glycoside hydrolase family 3 C-terminal domain-containing protein [Agromyces atrinae]